jgi:hypothetical protein
LTIDLPLPVSVAPGKVTAMPWDELHAGNAALSGEIRRSSDASNIALLTIDKMNVELAYLRRKMYGRSISGSNMLLEIE